MFEAVEEERVRADPAAVWALWEDPGRWAEWNEQVERAAVESAGPGEEPGVAPGAGVAVKMRRGGTVRYQVKALDPGRLLVVEARFPGAKLGHEHRVESHGRGAAIRHRTYVRGPLWPIFALLLGRGRMRRALAGFLERERELAEAARGAS